MPGSNFALCDCYTTWVRGAERQGGWSSWGQCFQAREMFDGELDSLKAIAATNTVTVPKPLYVLDNPDGGAALVLEYMDLKGLTRYSRQLGEEMAKMHLHNAELGQKEKEKESYVGKGENENEDEEQPVYMTQFGFHVTTCCGYLPQDNTFCDDWPTFYARQRLEHQLNLIEKDYGDKEVRELWSRLQNKIPNFFKDMTIEPALLHGDLWGGNVAESANGPGFKMWTPQRKVQCVLWLAKFESVTRVQREYRRVYNEVPPHRNNINRWDKQLKETGSLLDQKRSGRPSVSDESVDAIRDTYLRSPRNQYMHESLWDWLQRIQHFNNEEPMQALTLPNLRFNKIKTVLLLS
ncbi:Fructosamine-3-kinase [Blattella germanica]|nr:Fructosamine-3-kinase [Blattella germanica]